MKRLAIGLAIVCALAGCTAKSQVKSPVETENVAAVQSSPAIVYLCGARTKKGTACRNHVKAAGLRCHLHQGQPAM